MSHDEGVYPVTLAAGEIQASLAREFGVSPAVTNKINKEEIKP